MTLVRKIAAIYAVLLTLAALTNYLPGLTDAQGRAFGIFALDIYDDALHLASATWAAVAAYLSTRTGYLPVTVPAADKMRAEGFFDKHPNDEVAQKQLAAVEPWPWEPLLFRIERDVVEPRLEEAVLLDRDPSRILDEARALASRPG